MRKPRYLQIAAEIESQITSGELSGGAMLPTEQELQREFDVSRVTIRKALGMLVDKDLLYRVRGSGTYVKGSQARHDAFQLTGFNEEISAQGKVPGTRVLRFELTPADGEIATKLGLQKGAPIYAISRLRLIDGEPEILEETFLPVELFPDLSIEVMQQSKYEYVEHQKHYRISLSRQSVIPELPGSEVASALNIPMNQPVLKVLSVAELDTGKPFEYTIHYFRIHQYSFDFIARRGPE